MALTTVNDRGLTTPIDLLDNEKIRFGTGDDLEIFHNGTHSFINNSTGHLILTSTATDNVDIMKAGHSEYMARFKPDNAVELYYDNSKKLNTETWGVEVTGTLRADVINVLDNEKIKIGNDSDLEIYHDGNNSFIKDAGTGRLSIVTSQLQLTNAADSEVMIKATENAAVELYYDGVLKCSTYGDGLNFPDLGTLALGANNDMKLYHYNNNNYIVSDGGDLYIDTSAGHAFRIKTDQFNMKNAANTETLISADNGGAVSLYYDGTKHFETHTAGCKVSAGNLYLDRDNAKFILGNDDDLQIWHTGSYGVINNDVSQLQVQTDQFGITPKDGSEYMIYASKDSATNLYYNGSAKLATASTGISISGTIRSQGTYDATTSNSANMYVHSSPYDFYRSTSSIKYKDNVTTLTDAEADNILNCRPVTYTSKCTVDNSDDIHYGLIAEEVKNVDSRLVVFEGSEPENVKYDRFIPHLINLVKRLTDKVETLEAEVAALKG